MVRKYGVLVLVFLLGVAFLVLVAVNHLTQQGVLKEERKEKLFEEEKERPRDRPRFSLMPPEGAILFPKMVTITEYGKTTEKDVHYSSAHGINSEGTIIGSCSFDHNLRAFVWNVEEKTIQILPLPAAYVWMSATGVSENGLIVGFCQAHDIYKIEGYVWDPTVRKVTLLGGRSSALDISADGSVIVGTAYEGKEWEKSFPCVWEKENGMFRKTLLSVDVKADWKDVPVRAWVQAVSPDGRSVVGCIWGTSYQATLWRKEGAAWKVYPIGTTDAYAEAVTDDGIIVGTLLGKEAWRAYVWKDGRLTSLPLLEHYAQSEASAIYHGGIYVTYSTNRNESTWYKVAVVSDGKITPLFSQPEHCSVHTNRKGDVAGMIWNQARGQIIAYFLPCPK